MYCYCFISFCVNSRVHDPVRAAVRVQDYNQVPQIFLSQNLAQNISFKNHIVLLTDKIFKRVK
jgi:hypothetical protein